MSGRFFQGHTISSYIRNVSIRWRIMTAVLLAFILIGISMLLSLRMAGETLDAVGSSYQTNADLDLFTTQLSGAETAMETYMQYRTFESIDLYYQYQARIESSRIVLSDTPSTDMIFQKEYIVRQLSSTFVYYSGKTISARRANSISEADGYYDKTLQCYGMLKTAISALNVLYFKRNAQYYSNNRAVISAVTRNSFILILLVFTLTLIAVYIIISTITEPLIEISAVAHQIAERNFDIPLFNREGHDEIGTICQAFDRMIISIREYISTIWKKAAQENEMHEKEIEMRALYTDAQLRALQNQINPHFLFNTLNTGAQLAMMEEADKTSCFLEQVADFFRYNIQQTGRDSTIDGELGLVDNFIYIMKVRFGNRFEFIKEIPEGSYPDRIPGMILQPLVENCIKHGLHDISKGGKIFCALKGNRTASAYISRTGADFLRKSELQFLPRPIRLCFP